MYGKRPFNQLVPGLQNIIPPTSLASAFSIIVQLRLYYKLVVCYLCRHLCTLTSSCRETDVKAMLFTYFMIPTETTNIKCKSNTLVKRPSGLKMDVG